MLTDEEKMNMAWDSGSMPEYVSKDKILNFAEAIERAVLAKAGEQLPVAIKGCGAWDGLECLDELPDGSALYAHPLPAQAMPEWIDRSKIAPKHEQGEKILAFGNGYAFECEFDDGVWCSIGGDDFTHWMPLPDTSMLSASPKP